MIELFIIFVLIAIALFGIPLYVFISLWLGEGVINETPNNK
jgi:hypothetical protein